MLDEVRQLQVVLRFHGDADVGDGTQHGALRSVLGLVGENLGPAPLVRVKVSLPVGGKRGPQTGPAVQEVHLGPQINQPLGGRRAGQHHFLDKPADALGRLKPLALGVFETGAFIENHHVKRPGLLVVVHQPLKIFTVDDIDIRRSVEGLDALGGTPQDGGHPKMLEVVSATFLGATTRTLATCQRKYLRMLTADRVMTVLPSPGRRNSPTVGSSTTRWMQ